MKDIVQLILSAIETSLDADIAIQEVTDAREQLFNSYEKHLACLNDEEALAFHNAKNQALKIESFLKLNLDDKTDVSLLTLEQKRHLYELRTELTDTQNLLRDSRTERLIQRKGIHDIERL
jgi:hypothetical protein